MNFRRYMQMLQLYPTMYAPEHNATQSLPEKIFINVYKKQWNVNIYTFLNCKSPECTHRKHQKAAYES